MSNVPIDDAARAAKSGGRRELNRFLDMLRPLVCRWALVWTGSPDVAEDVAQAVLMRVHRSLREYVPSGRVTTWVYRITKNMLMDFDQMASREQHRREVLERDVSEIIGEHPDALDLLARVDLLARFMKELSPQQRAALDLVELQGFSHAEAADMLEVSPSTLRVHLHRARDAIGEHARRDDEEQWREA